MMSMWSLLVFSLCIAGAVLASFGATPGLFLLAVAALPALDVILLSIETDPKHEKKEAKTP